LAVTRSRTAERADAYRPGGRLGPAAGWRLSELLWLLAAAAVAATGLTLVYQAKLRTLPEQTLNLNDLPARESLLPLLTPFAEPAERAFVARKIYNETGNLGNVGAIALLHATPDEIRRTRGLKSLQARLGDSDRPVSLLTAPQLRVLKPLLSVRPAAAFKSAFRLWVAVFFAGFLLLHIFWSVRGFAGDQAILPGLLLLTGIGMMLMVSLRDPVRDSLIFVDFAQGVAGGCALMAAASALDYERIFGRLSFVPLLGSFLLSVLLIVFGYGPGVSDAKVNLLGFQPVEIIRILLILFLAGYFARRWDVLRHARETRASVVRITGSLPVPPLEYVLPVFVCAAFSVVFFFLQRDMGPALVFAGLFLVMYAMAREGALVPAVGLSLIVAGFAAGYFIGVPHNVGARVSMWLSPWDNLVHGGDQLAHSLWAFSTGEIFGTGVGLGDPQVVPAGHTDLILAALGEELGFLGIFSVFAIYALLVWRGLRSALRARNDYEFFLATGLVLSLALQLLLISGGALGVVPLSGVVTPFLSYGRTAMLANFAMFAMLLSVSARGGSEERGEPFRAPVRVLGIVLGVAGAVVVAKAGYVQVLRAAPTMGAGTLVVQADGARRYQYNPRFQDIMREIPKGSIYDRNGLPLATSKWEELEQHRSEYQALGVDIDRACSRADNRHYPFGGLMFDLLGDLRTRVRWGAGNTSFVERESATRLRGYDDRATLVDVQNPTTGKMERVVRYDYRELVPLLRYRYEPERPEVRRVLDRPRDVHMSLDARLQVRAAAILANQLKLAGQEKGALVALDPATGDLLASVSLPVPPAAAVPGGVPPGPESPDSVPLLDRARYGLYPPGSTFKVVTAIAALRKNPLLAQTTYQCTRLPDGRVGSFIKGSNRPIRDDVQDKSPHGTVNLERGVTISCNAYFAQLGTYDVGADALWETAHLLGIATAAPDTAKQLRKSLPQSSYGQGQVVASPFQLARVAATVANGGLMPYGRWVTDETNERLKEPLPILAPALAGTLGRYMRAVVTSGTGRKAGGAALPIAGKTGTAELADAPSHAWFIGYAPYGPAAHRIAFAVLVENGQYGGAFAAPAAAELVSAAAKLGMIGGQAGGKSQ
jgi:cell division protein FtsW (lipid II flippase)/cell division protein FtsI/penicillin-binding protein 2